MRRMRLIKEKLLFCTFAVIVPLLFGALLYYLICPEVYFVREVDYYTDINVHISTDMYANSIVRFIRNYFFDFLWAYAFANSLYLLGNDDIKVVLINCGIAVFVGWILEVLQLIEIAHGTFDVLDMIYELLGAGCAALIIMILRRKEK